MKYANRCFVVDCLVFDTRLKEWVYWWCRPTIKQWCILFILPNFTGRIGSAVPYAPRWPKAYYAQLGEGDDEWWICFHLRYKDTCDKLYPNIAPLTFYTIMILYYYNIVGKSFIQRQHTFYRVYIKNPSLKIYLLHYQGVLIRRIYIIHISICIINNKLISTLANHTEQNQNWFYS